MNQQPHPLFYLAGSGFISPVGPTAKATYFAVEAGMSAYQLSNYSTASDDPIKMASLPNQVFESVAAEIDEGNAFNYRHDRMIKMAIFAVDAACQACPQQQPIPTVLGLPNTPVDTQGLGSLTLNLQHNCQPWINQRLSRNLCSGRAAGMEALAFVADYLYSQEFDYFLVGGVDSFEDDEVLRPLDEQGRLLTTRSGDGFVPGEGACFLLLTKRRELAEVRNGHIIAIHPPAFAEEPGHLYADQANLGEGLDKAFKLALHHQPAQSIQAIYSSMNGENYWAKEYGVAHIRNTAYFAEKVRIEHPADCYGDLGAATATGLICMAAESLHHRKGEFRHLVYCSADNATRAALVVEKLPL